jgi:dTDP-4-amino-4,6-dideoxygalactose transaminase
MKEPYIVFGSPYIGDEEIDEVTKTLKSGWIGSGPKVTQFENEFAEYVGAKHAVALNSCTAGLHLSMVCSGLKPGDEVITTTLTFAATANSIVHVGAIPVFVDVDQKTMNIDPDKIEAAITPKTRAIIPVHFAGRPCDMDAINSIAKKHNLIVIEDAAHCIEGKYGDQKIGSISPMTCFSFYVTKNMTTAEGGMITTNDGDIAKQIKSFGLHGMSSDAWKRFSDEGYKHYEVVYPGFKYNMTDIAASLGLCQLPRLDSWMKRREEIWTKYDEAFSDLLCWVPEVSNPGDYHARHLYTLLLDIDNLNLTRDQMIIELHKRGIGTGVHYRALHLHQYYRERFGFKPDDFPNAAWISDRTFSIPLSANLSDSEVDRIISNVKEILTKKG